MVVLNQQFTSAEHDVPGVPARFRNFSNKSMKGF